MAAENPWTFGWTQLLTVTGFIITIVIAIGGFRTFGRWKREKIEERRIETSIEMLAIAYEAKFIFDTIRSPASFSYEYEDMSSVEGETNSQRGKRGSFYAILKRVERSKEFFERAWKLQPRCAAVFGIATDDIFMLMHQARREIEVSAQMLMWYGPEVPRDTVREWERDVWEMGKFEPEKDRVGKKLLEFRERTERLCRPIVDKGLRTHTDQPLMRLSAYLHKKVSRHS